MGIWVDEEVRGLMREAAYRERMASLFAGIITAVLIAMVVGAMVGGIWYTHREQPPGVDKPQILEAPAKPEPLQRFDPNKGINA